MEEGIKACRSFTDCCRERLNLRDMNPAMNSPLALAYLGDAVYAGKLLSQSLLRLLCQVPHPPGYL